MSNKNNQDLKKGIEILNKAITNNKSINQIESESGLYQSYLSKLKRRAIRMMDRGEDIDTELVLEYNNLYEKIKNEISTHVPNNSDTKKSINTDIDESFDDRSMSWVERDDDGKITKYKFKILVRDEKPFIGDISTEQMEKIFQYYPYVTRNSISQQFPYFTFIQFKRILRVFNITKDKLFPQHIIENHTEEEIAEFALKAKETSAYKKYVDQKGAFLENKLNETQKQLYLLNEEKAWINKIVEQIISEREETSIRPIPFTSDKPIVFSDTLFTLFSDIHFGKKFKITSPLYRGNSKEILHERMMTIARETVREFEFKNKKSIALVCIGDLLESILPDGMHPQHTFEMDLFGHEQVMFALESFEQMMSYILDKTDSSVGITLYGIGGNHDRIGLKRDEDKRRSGSAIIYAMLDKYIFKNNDRVKVINPDDEIIKESIDGVSLIGFHGDSSLSKRTALEIINTFKNGHSHEFNLIVQGHWHSMKPEVGMNYLYITLPSVCSTDNFIKNELGKGAQPAFLTGEKSHNGYGFDFRYITLY